MRHLKSGRALGVKPAHRRAMMRNLVTSLLEHQQIRTTMARAKELRKPMDKMITLGKKGDLSARRRALSFVKSKRAMQRLFSELPERYEERQGGYVRIIRMGPRKGDGADMALVQLVDAPNDALANAQQPKARRRGAGGGRTVTEEVAAQVKGKGKQEEAAEQEGKPAKAEAKKDKAEAKAESKVAKEEAKKDKAEAKAESKAAKEAAKQEKVESKAAAKKKKDDEIQAKQAAGKDEAPASKAEESPKPETAKQDDEAKS